MYCIRCGTRNNETDKNCYNCGAVLVPPPIQTAPPSADDYPYPLPSKPSQSPAPNSPANPPPDAYPTSGYPYPNHQAQPSAANYPVNPPPGAYPSAPPPQPNYYQQPPSQPPNYYLQPSQPNYYLQPPQPYQPSAQSYAPAYNPNAFYFHPLLTGANNLPPEVMMQPANYYSYVGPDGKVRLARRIGFGVRFGAQLIDTIIVFVPFLILTAVFMGFSVLNSSSISNTDLAQVSNPSTTANLLYFVVSGLYFTVLSVLSNGQSWGKRALKIKVIRLDGQKLDWLTSILRHLLGYTLSGAVLLLGYITVATDSQKQGWHDKLARTLVVHTQILEEGRDFALPGRNFGSR